MGLIPSPGYVFGLRVLSGFFFLNKPHFDHVMRMLQFWLTNFTKIELGANCAFKPDSYNIVGWAAIAFNFQMDCLLNLRIWVWGNILGLALQPGTNPLNKNRNEHLYPLINLLCYKYLMPFPPHLHPLFIVTTTPPAFMKLAFKETLFLLLYLWLIAPPINLRFLVA